jgi:hypothetical protein
VLSACTVSHATFKPALKLPEDSTLEQCLLSVALRSEENRFFGDTRDSVLSIDMVVFEINYPITHGITGTCIVE